MRRTPVMIMLGVVVPLLFLLFYCGAINVSNAEEVSVKEGAPAAEAVKAPEAVVKLLADTHKTAGVECADCHKETPPASEVSTEVCLTCHAGYKDVAASSIDPHNAHVSFTRCGDCHHAHKASENQCLSCHTFKLQTP
jgi:hypothetical protein